MITVADVKAVLLLDPKDTFDDADIQASIDAALAYMNRTRTDRDWRYPAGDEKRGLILLASKMHERRGSNGEQNAGFEFSGPVPLIDNELARLLGIDKYFGPATA